MGTRVARSTFMLVIALVARRREKQPGPPKRRWIFSKKKKNIHVIMVYFSGDMLIFQPSYSQGIC